MMRRVLIGAGSVVLLVVLALALAPSIVGPGPLVNAVEQRVLQTTGRPLVIDGAVSWSLLPAPSVRAAGLHLANIEGGAALDLASAARIEAHLAFWPLVTGRVEIVGVTIDAPILNLEILADGRRNWLPPPPAPTPPAAAPPAAAPPAAAPPATAVASPAVPSAPRSPTPLVLRQIAIGGGTVSLTRPGRRILATAVTLTAEGDLVPLGPDLLVPARALASLSSAGLKLDATLLMSRPVSSGVPAKLTLDLAEPSAPEISAKATFDGVSDGTGFFGALSLASDHPARLANRFKEAGFDPGFDPGFDQRARRLLGTAPARLGGWVRVADAIVEVSDLEGMVAGVEVSGHAAVPLARPAGSDIDLTLSAIDLDKVATGSPPSSIGPPPAVPVGPLGKPDGRIRLTASSVAWHGQILRNVELVGRATAGEAAILPARIDFDHATATVPGDGRVSLSGSVTDPATQPHFAGRLEAMVPDLRTLLAALGHPAGTVEAGRLASGSLAADLVVDRKTFSAGHIDLRIDASHVTGNASVRFAPRLSVALTLDAGDLNLDGYLQRPAPTADPPPIAPNRPLAAVPLSPFALTAGVLVAGGLLRQGDIDLSLGVGHLLWRDTAFDGLHIAAAVTDGRLTLRDLSIGSALGAKLRATGSFLPAGPHGPQLSLGIDASGEDLGRVTRTIAPRLPAGLDLSGAFQLHATGTSGFTDGRADITLSALGGKLIVGGTQAQFGRQLTARFSLEHPSFAGLVGRLTRRYRPLENGPATLSAALSQTAGGWKISDAMARAGASSASGSGSIELFKGRRHIAATVADAHLDLDRLLPLPALPFGRTVDLRNLGGFDGQFGLKGDAIRWNGWTLENPALAATLAAGTLTLKQLSGRFLGGGFSANGSAKANNTAGERVSATLSAAIRNAVWTPDKGPALGLLQPALTLERGTFSLGAELQSRGSTVGDLVQAATGVVSASASDGAVGGMDLAVIGRAVAAEAPEADAVPAAALNRGQTPFATAGARLRFSNGSVAIDKAALAGPAGQADATGGIDFMAGHIAARLALTLPNREVTPGINLEGPLAQPSFLSSAVPLPGR